MQAWPALSVLSKHDPLSLPCQGGTPDPHNAVNCITRWTLLWLHTRCVTTGGLHINPSVCASRYRVDRVRAPHGQIQGLETTPVKPTTPLSSQTTVKSTIETALGAPRGRITGGLPDRRCRAPPPRPPPPLAWRPPPPWRLAASRPAQPQPAGCQPRPRWCPPPPMTRSLQSSFWRACRRRGHTSSSDHPEWTHPCGLSIRKGSSAC